MQRRLLSLLIMIYVCSVAVYGTLHTDSLVVYHGVTDSLSEISVVGIGSRKAVINNSDGSLDLNGKLLGEGAGIAGANDPVSFLHTLPSVGTAGELSTALNVRGSGRGANTFLINGARVINPMHLFGIYSAFNSSFFSQYRFYPSMRDACQRNTSGAILEAFSLNKPLEKGSGEISVGIIESHAGVHLPMFGNKGLCSFGGRITYLSLLFPDILKIDNSFLKYGFSDFNASYSHFLSNESRLTASFFYSNDDLEAIVRHDGSKDGEFGWNNIIVNMGWSSNKTSVNFSLSGFKNKFRLSEAGRELNLPSSLWQIELEAEHQINRFRLETDLTCRRASGQYNAALMADDGSRRTTAIEWNIAGDYKYRFSAGVEIRAGLRAAFYFCGGYHRIAPLPRLDISYDIKENLRLNFFVGRYMRFDRLVEESTTGMPVDFYINSSERSLPEDVQTVELGLSGTIPGLWVDYSLEGYYKRLKHSGEFAGSILDLLNVAYDPLTDLIDGKGYACGVSVFVSRQFGSLRCRVGYNLGKSRLKFDRYGDRYFPASYDRLHDLSATVVWNPIRILTLGATFTHSTGIPYTQAKYGYIIAENLICEYYPHNSSRLPSYNRLDLSCSLKLGHHSINISVYNALANRNILFMYNSFYLLEGLKKRESVMKNVIPSISYSYSF